MSHLIILTKLVLLVCFIALMASRAEATWWTKIAKLGDGDVDIRGVAALGRLSSSLDSISPDSTHRFLLDFDSEKVNFKEVKAGGVPPGIAVSSKEQFHNLWADLSNAIVIEQNQVDALERWLPDDTQKRQIILLDKDENPYPASVGNVDRKVDIDIMLRPDLTYRFDPPPGLGTLNKMLAVTIRRSDTRVISLFDDLEVDVAKAIDVAAGDTHRRLPANSLGDLEALVKREKPGLVVLVGHVEDEAFTIRMPTGEVGGRIDLDKAERLLERNTATALFLGCGTGAIGLSGFEGCVNALDVAEGLSKIRDGATHGELLAALTSQAGPVLVQPRMVNGVLRGFEARLRADGSAERLDHGYTMARLSSVRLSQDSGAAGFRTRDALQALLTHPEYWLWAWLILTVVGLGSTIFMIRQHWRDYREAFPVQATPLSGRLRRGVVSWARSISFLAGVPALAAAQMIVLLVSAFVLLELFMEEWFACLLLAVGAGAVVPFLNRAGRTFWRTVRQDWRDIVVNAGLPVLIAMVMFNRPIMAKTGLGPAIRPWLVGEAYAMLFVVGIVACVFLVVRYRWGVGAFGFLNYGYQRIVFSVAASVDRRLHGGVEGA